jgi:hypothetical protein
MEKLNSEQCVITFVVRYLTLVENISRKRRISSKDKENFTLVVHVIFGKKDGRSLEGR